MARNITTTFVILVAMGMLLAMGSGTAMGQPSNGNESTVRPGGAVAIQVPMDLSELLEKSEKLAGELKTLDREAQKSIELTLYAMAEYRLRTLAEHLNEDTSRLEMIRMESPSDEIRVAATELLEKRRELQVRTQDMLRLLALR